MKSARNGSKQKQRQHQQSELVSNNPSHPQQAVVHKVPLQDSNCIIIKLDCIA